ncbi:MAG TPA: amidase [Perlabentimonas sp.]|jgi:Asp-tRNA(Asn)/Glu-tRNA(Gln) amidotransferase A subunit family amidase|nr:amidase [Perlabentimonas sp.]
MKTNKTTLTVVVMLMILSIALNLYQHYNSKSLTSKLKGAEKLFALNFTNSERDLLKDDVTEAIECYELIHEFDIQNDLEFSLVFAPVPPSYSPNFESNSSDFDLPQNVSLPENREDLCFYTIAELSYLVKNRVITSKELTEIYLNRIKDHDPELLSVITLLEERALKQAQQMDEEMASGKHRGPLHGIPYGVKDLLALKDYPFTYGSPIYKDQIATTTASVIDKLDEAGAVLVAKLSLGEFAWGDVWFGGKTRNPWNTERGSSGSSAGSASATAGGLVTFALGSETWGSIVSPSTECGVTGLRPTFGRVSRTGAMTLSWSMDKIGPICRTAQDCALVINAISSIDNMDKVLVDVPLNINLNADISTLRVGITEDYFKQDYPFKTNDSIALQAFKELGIDFIPVKLPEHLPMSVLSSILDVEAAAAFSHITLNNLDDQMVRQGKNAWPNHFRKARFVPAVEYIQANRIRTVLIDEFSKLFEEVDVIITPSFAGNQLLMTNLTGHPAISIPTGFSDNELPTSITLISNWYREDQILLLAKKYQDKTQWFRENPKGFSE